MTQKLPNRDLTTGDAAKIAGVSQSLIIRWCNVGILKSYLVPGSKHRRISRRDLQQVIREHGMPENATQKTGAS